MASMSRCPCSTPRATGTVWLSLEIRKISGRKNSFQVQMKKKTSSTARVGRLIGTTTRHSTCQRPAPSIRAASRTSRGKTEHRGEQVGAEGRLDDHEDEHDREPGVVEADLLGEVVQRVDQRLVRKGVGQQEDDQQPHPALHPPDAEGIGVQGRHDHREHRHRPTDQEAVEQLLSVVDAVPEVDDPLEVEPVRQRQRAVAGVLGRGLQGIHGDDDEGHQHQQREDRQHRERRESGGSRTSGSRCVLVRALDAQEDDGQGDDQQRQHGRDGGAVADLGALEEVLVGVVRRDVGGATGTATGQDVDRAEDLQRRDRESTAARRRPRA